MSVESFENCNLSKTFLEKNEFLKINSAVLVKIHESRLLAESQVNILAHYRILKQNSSE